MCSAPPWCAPCCCHHQGASRTPPAPTAEPGHHSFLLPLSQQTNSKHQTQPWDVRKNAAVAACGTQPSIAKAGSIPQASRVTQKASGARARTSDTGKDQPPTGTASRCCRHTAQYATASQCQPAEHLPRHKSNSAERCLSIVLLTHHPQPCSNLPAQSCPPSPSPAHLRLLWCCCRLMLLQ
jgi:hypothetical protein